MVKEPLQLRNLTLRNRIVMPPMATGRAVDGKPDEDLIAYYKARARGTAVIIVEHEYIMPQGMAHPSQLSMAEDSVIPAYRRLTDAVHEEGAKIIAQLNHAGAKAKCEGCRPAGPSDIAFQDMDVPVPLTREGIRDVLRAFADAALRAKEAGFDGVEIHSAHGYLLNEFYSPVMNRRTDEYAVNTMENRTRIQREAVREVRKAVGEDYTVGLRFGACDFLPGGSEIGDIPEAVRQFNTTDIDFLDVSGGMLGFLRPGRTGAGYLKDLGLAAKSESDVPVIITGGVSRVQDAEDLLQEGAGDLIGVGRALMNDADWSVRALEE